MNARTTCGPHRQGQQFEDDAANSHLQVMTKNVSLSSDERCARYSEMVVIGATDSPRAAIICLAAASTSFVNWNEAIFSSRTLFDW